MEYAISHIAKIIGARPVIVNETVIDILLLDSRKVFAPVRSLFFALKSPRRNGHHFISPLYHIGVRNFVVDEAVDISLYPDANFLRVDNCVHALQQLATAHRNLFSIPVIGITGSNGKTIVKEWLYQLLQDDFNIVRSPKSYNSQIGVPLSLWQMNDKHTLAIFEAGISQPGEMEKLEKMIRPTIGLLTNIGEAHSEGFADAAHKEKEKRILFQHCGLKKPATDITIQKQVSHTEIGYCIEHNPAQHFLFTIPFTDDASIQNAISCLQILLQLNIKPEAIASSMLKLHPVSMRLELKKGINNCIVVNDSYSADLSSLEIALGFLNQQSGDKRKTVILTDFLQSAMPDQELFTWVIELLERNQISRLIGIGERIEKSLSGYHSLIAIELFATKEKFLEQFLSSRFKDEAILIKGARVFELEDLVQLLELKTHQTVLEINLNAIVHNLKAYQCILKPNTKVMAMVKAFAYGSGGAEIAGVLQFNNVDYLGVAYADEGVELRKAGIMLPIMVMNPEPSAFEKMVAHHLEPELYSFEILHQFELFLKQEGFSFYPIHLEIETGMNRLGFAISDLDKLATALLSTDAFKLQSVFTHLAASEEAAHDAFSMEQYQRFEKAVSLLKTRTGFTFISHIANSAAAIRHPQMQMDMVRLGIGLYGVDSAASEKLNLQTVATLKSTIAQLKKLEKGDTVSYNRKGVVENNATIATIRLGYADGFPRRLGNGAGQVWVNGKRAPVIGTVCMDMFMVDVSNIENVKAGDTVIIFGKELPVVDIASAAQTIPYEIMTGISQRVKRVYYVE